VLTDRSTARAGGHREVLALQWPGELRVYLSPVEG
jgi:hypothetical protein